MYLSRQFAFVIAAMSCAFVAQAELIDRGDGLIYDDALDVTWLQDASLAASNTFGLPTGVSLGTHPSDNSGISGIIDASGRMNWPGALHWIDAMNAHRGTGYKGYDNWRLPTISPINGVGFNIRKSANATSDRGYAPTTTDGSDGGWRDGSNSPVNEMGHMYYVNLANFGLCDPNATYCTEQAGWGLNITSFVDALTGRMVPFDNVQSYDYWTGTEFDANFAWFFRLQSGGQDIGSPFVAFDKSYKSYVWAVRDGDVLPDSKLVTIDIKPGSDPNCFNANGHGVIPVAVLGTESFDVSNIDQATLSFGGSGVRVRGNKGPFCGAEDVNFDGFYDLVCHFEDNPEYWEPGQGEATLTGALLDGTSIEGTDTICIVP